MVNGKIVVDTDVDDTEMEAMLAAEHVDTAATTREVDHLLPGDFAGRHTDTLALDAVIATQQQMTGMGQRGL